MAAKTPSAWPRDLTPEQALAARPGDQVWLSASAGTGKTHVLTARVKRLLLDGVDPDAILCLTFTKAGAAEMAERISRDLATWVMTDDGTLAAHLKAIGAGVGRDTIARARTLFAKLLEARSGGLRVLTIHAFCQTLLAGFPLEAGLVPGFRPIEGGEETALRHETMATLAMTAEAEGDARLIGALRTLSMRIAEAGTQKFFGAALRYEALLDARIAFGPAIRRALGLPGSFDRGALAALCTDAAIDAAMLRSLAVRYRDWSPSDGPKRAAAIELFLALDPAGRVDAIPSFANAFVTGKGGMRAEGPKDAPFREAKAQAFALAIHLQSHAERLTLSNDLDAALYAAQRYAIVYDAAKRARGVVDFDDMIRRTVALLDQPGIGDWIGYKLDQRIDHILVDEAQDTNNAQWTIIRRLSEEFFAGAGAKGTTGRTLFTVGDFKQAIFGFQGTDPEHYANAAGEFGARAAAADKPLQRLDLTDSFRSSPAILDVVDAVLDGLGPAALRLQAASSRHRSNAGGYGEVLWLPPVTGDEPAADEGGEDDESWIPEHERRLADRIATMVRGWIRDRVWLAKANRAIRPGDVMILLRGRGVLASLLVARLQRHGVRVAGVDRLSLKSPLAVQDLVAAMRFALQPDDDLTLAALLVSPIIGWSQDELFAVAHGRGGRSLWAAMPPGAARDALLLVLNAADRGTPYAFLEELLSGPLQARAALLARLGEEARDPIDELLAAALGGLADGRFALQDFVDWFDRNDGDIKREADGADDVVRVMTVHAAKGLQAPVVILADAWSDPALKLPDLVDIALDGLDGTVPIPHLRKDERDHAPAFAERADELMAKDRAEHWRLLYVAMTRAEERLVIAGSHGAKPRSDADTRRWGVAVRDAMTALGAATVRVTGWPTEALFISSGTPPATPAHAAAVEPAPVRPAPDWLTAPAPVEARPPRPLAPSSLGVEAAPGDAPPGPGNQAAAARGKLLHALFERLPGLAPDRRATAARAFVAAHPDGGEGEADAIVAAAMGVVDAHPDLFAEGGLSEAPIAGVVGTAVIAGTVDRLIVRADRVLIVDYKTGRRVPSDADAVPTPYLRQMAAYRAVVRQLFPDRAVAASLLYTEAATLIALPDPLLDAHAPG